MEETIQTLTDGKQDKIFNLKQGFFSPQEGKDTDIGICTKEGKFYLAVKLNEEWHFSEIKKAKDLKNTLSHY